MRCVPFLRSQFPRARNRGMAIFSLGSSLFNNNSIRSIVVEQCDLLHQGPTRFGIMPSTMSPMRLLRRKIREETGTKAPEAPRTEPWPDLDNVS